MNLSMDGAGPLYAQLTRALKAAIMAGGYANGNQLPPTRVLAQELGVSRNTVLAAYERLQAEGFIDGKTGSGSYVASPLHATTADDPQPFTTKPQSRYSQRARQCENPMTLAGRTAPGTRYAFQYGLPLINPILTGAWGRELARAAAYTSLNYPVTQGVPALREAVCSYLVRRRGVKATPADILIVHGTQQAISLSARVILDEGDPVAIEEPQYFAVRRALEIHGARLMGVAVDAEGLRTDLLPQQSPKMICVTPSHQFPTGALMSVTRRLELLRYAREHDSWIFEDDYDGEFRYDGMPLAALRSLDQDGRVIYVGSFSKTMFPSLRLGYLVMPVALRREFITAKWAQDFGTSAIEQAALANLMANDGFERHLRRVTPILKSRRKTLLDGLRNHSRGRLEISDSRAGMHVVVWLKNKTAAEGRAFVADAQRMGLGLHSIAPHYIDPPDRAGLLMGYGGMSAQEIEKALLIFARCLDEAYDRPARKEAMAMAMAH